MPHDLTDVHLKRKQRRLLHDNVRTFPAQPATYGHHEAIGAITWYHKAAGPSSEAYG
jgi:hypothetical protein